MRGHGLLQHFAAQKAHAADGEGGMKAHASDGEGGVKPCRAQQDKPLVSRPRTEGGLCFLSPKREETGLEVLRLV